MQNIEVYVNDQLRVIEPQEAAQYYDWAMDYGKKYLALIKDEKIRNFAERMWIKAPAYFFVIPASSTGKYHAAWATELGGLFLHVCMGMYVASELAGTFELSDLERDCAIAAMAGHDCLKYGANYDRTLLDVHPFLPRSYYGTPKAETFIRNWVEPHAWTIIMDAIETHMGNMYSGEWLMKATQGASYATPQHAPKSDVQKVVHLADYIASRKELGLADFFATGEAE